MNHGFSFSDGQMKQLSKALSSKSGATLRLKPEQLKGGTVLPLNKTQHSKVQKALAANKGLQLTLSGKVLKDAVKLNGGLSPFLAGLASQFLGPAIKMGTNAGLNVLDWGVNKVSGNKVKRGQVKNNKLAQAVAKIGGDAANVFGMSKLGGTSTKQSGQNALQSILGSLLGNGLIEKDLAIVANKHKSALNKFHRDMNKHGLTEQDLIGHGLQSGGFIGLLPLLLASTLIGQGMEGSGSRLIGESSRLIGTSLQGEGVRLI